MTYTQEQIEDLATELEAEFEAEGGYAVTRRTFADFCRLAEQILSDRES